MPSGPLVPAQDIGCSLVCPVCHRGMLSNSDGLRELRSSDPLDTDLIQQARPLVASCCATWISAQPGLASAPPARHFLPCPSLKYPISVREQHALDKQRPLKHPALRGAYGESVKPKVLGGAICIFCTSPTASWAAGSSDEAANRYHIVISFRLRFRSCLPRAPIVDRHWSALVRWCLAKLFEERLMERRNVRIII